MGSVGSPNNRAPYDANYRECSLGICNRNCPQWCSMVFPPPPPFFTEKEDDDDSKTNFSPLIIAIIGILASTVILVIYYTLISKYCRRRRDHRNRINQIRSDQAQVNHHDLQWQVPSTGGPGGLDERLIKSIAVCKYKKGDGLIEGTECVVCLSEFQEDESLRLLPECGHAFHLPCIDTWLKSHSNCPVCRASVVSGNSQSVPIQNSSSTVNVSSLEVQRREDLVFVVDGGREREGEVVVSFGGDEIDDSASPSVGRFRRSISVDSFSCQADEDPRTEIRRSPPGIGSSGEIWGDDRRSKDGNALFDLVRSPVAGVKRSVSTERFKITKNEKAKNSVIPI